jgi:hypothetical protein
MVVIGTAEYADSESVCQAIGALVPASLLTVAVAQKRLLIIRCRSGSNTVQARRMQFPGLTGMIFGGVLPRGANVSAPLPAPALYAPNARIEPRPG